MEVEEKPQEETSIEDILCNEAIMDLEFHPTQNIVGVGLITGEVYIYKYVESNEAYKGDSNQLLYKIPPPESSNSNSNDSSDLFSCRCLKFTPDGKCKITAYKFNDADLVTGSSDKSINVIDLNAMKTIISVTNAHESPLSVMMLHNAPTNGANILVSGDDNGIVKVWDLRVRKNTFQFEDNEDFIADLGESKKQPHMVVASGGDGYLSVFNLRKGELEARSDNLEDELLSLAVIKDGSKVVVGSQDGILNIWDWGDWGDISDRYPGHPQSVSAIVKIDESTICTGSSDGIIRVVSILPNKLLGVIGEHQDFPIEKLKMSRDSKFLASSSHDNTVKFWNVQFLYERDDDSVNEGEENEEDVQMEDTGEKEEETEMTTEEETNKSKKKKKKNSKNTKNSQNNQFFSNLL